MSQSIPRRQALRGEHWALTVLLIVVCISIPLGNPSWAALKIIGFGLALATYAAVTTFGDEYWQRAGRRAVTSGYFGVQLLLVVAIAYFSDFSGAFWLVLMPVVASSVKLGSRAAMILVWALLLAAFVVPLGLATGRWEIIPQFALPLISGMAFVAVFMLLLRREEQARAEVERLAGALGEANARLRIYAEQAEELATTRERNRVARDIHDSLGHYLTVVNVQIEVARTVLASDQARALDALAKAQQLTRDGLHEVRQSVTALRAAPFADRSLAEALGDLAEECRSGGIVAVLEIHGPPRPLPAQTELTLYRAVQEGLTNVRKHASATRVDISLDYRPASAVLLRIADNGRGQPGAGGGFGLVGIRERVALAGGAAEIRSAPGQGFEIKIEVPG